MIDIEWENMEGWGWGKTRKIEDCGLGNMMKYGGLHQSMEDCTDRFLARFCK